MSKSEATYQAQLIKKLKSLLPGCIILKNDANYIQGVPDLLILFRDRWAALEVKRSSNAQVRPNQEHYVRLMNEYSYAAFIYPEIEGAVLAEIQESLQSDR